MQSSSAPYEITLGSLAIAVALMLLVRLLAGAGPKQEVAP